MKDQRPKEVKYIIPQDNYKLPAINGNKSEYLRFVGPGQEPVIMPPRAVMGSEIIDPHFRNKRIEYGEPAEKK